MTPGIGQHWGSTAPVDDRLWRYAEVECARCGVTVRVAKFSPQHTSIQWTSEGVLGCAEFSARLAAGGDYSGGSGGSAPRASTAGGSGGSPPRASTALIPTCASLRDSIDDAVAGGRVKVGLGGEEAVP